MYTSSTLWKLVDYKNNILLIAFTCFIYVAGFSQKTTIVDSSHMPAEITVIAGKQYDKSSFHEFLWGKHYRKDWATPVKVPVMNLDTVDGGLKAYQRGGGRQSITIRLRNSNGKEYVLRSIDKRFGKALPEMYRGMFIEDIINDQVSIAQPYSGVTVADMAEAAGIYHTIPRIVFIPKQPALGEFSNELGDQLYLFEQRPDENWEEAANFGNSKKIVGTDKMLEKIWKENDRRPDQLSYVKARIFDMFLGDWGRQEDQWRWAETEVNGKKLYHPIPRDRDQVYTKFDGALLSLAISLAGAGHLESFRPNMKNVETYNFPARNLDRQIANEPVREDWIRIAKELQAALTDELIEQGIKELPEEIYAISGEEIIQTLKLRRDNMQEYALDYYKFLAREVEVTGTQEAEYFEIKKVNDGISVNIYDINSDGTIEKDAYYSRTFLPSETKEIRIYGIGGKDKYYSESGLGNSIKIRIIGGPAADQYNMASRVQVYDNPGNDFTGADQSRKHLSDNPFINSYRYDAFQYDSRGFSPRIFYSSEDHIYAGLQYQVEKKKWRKYPYGSKNELSAKYSITEKAFSFEYDGIFKQAIAKWDLVLNANYDFMRWNNFFGIGNETPLLTNDRNFYRARTKEFEGSLGLQKNFGNYHTLGISGVYQHITLLDDLDRFIHQYNPLKPPVGVRQFGSAVLDYTFQKVDNVLIPFRGIKFNTQLSYTQNLKQKDSSVTKANAYVNFYIPLSKSFVISIKTGGATLEGKPEFYQLNRLGSGKTLRGYKKYRFHGESMAYAQNELQFVKEVKSYLYSGKFGLLALYDVGRVWASSEKSSAWHTGYGGGIILAPFNKFSIALIYAVSKNERDFSARIVKGL